MPLYHYVITRADLSVGEQAAHILHAAAQSSHGLHDDTTHAVVLVVPDELTLYSLWRKFSAAGIPGKLIADHGEEPFPDSPSNCMAIGLVPTRDRGPIRKLTSHLPLLRSAQKSVPVSLNTEGNAQSVGSKPVPSATSTHSSAG